MSRFTDVLIVSPLADGKSWYLRRSFGYAVGSKDSGDVVEVLEGFQTDFTSVPRPLWWLFPTWGKYGNAAVIHDFMYSDQSRTRKESDLIFLEAMRVLNVGGIPRTLLYLAVKFFGSFAWRSVQRRKEQGESRVAARPPEKSYEKPADLKAPVRV
jgi:hypothetical protein